MTSHVFKNKVNSLIPKEKIYEFLKKNKIEIDDKFFDFLNNMFESSPKIAKDQFKLIMKELTKYDETIAIFSKYLEEEKKNHLIHTKESYLTVENLKDFFMYEQDQIFNNDSYIKKIIQSFEPVTEDSFLDDETMSIDGFKKMLFSNHNQIFDVNKLRTYQVFC